VPIVATDGEIAVESPYPVNGLLPQGAVPAESMPKGPPQPAPQMQETQIPAAQPDGVARGNPAAPAGVRNNYGWHLNRSESTGGAPIVKPASFDPGTAYEPAQRPDANKPAAPARGPAAGEPRFTNLPPVVAEQPVTPTRLP
jgi:hypothetical protein